MHLFLLPFLVAPPLREAKTVHTERMAHVVGLRLDYGRALDFGLAHLHTHESTTARGGLGGMVVFQYGIDGRVVSDEGAFRGGLLFTSGRISLVGDAGARRSRATPRSSPRVPVVYHHARTWTEKPPAGTP